MSDATMRWSTQRATNERTPEFWIVRDGYGLTVARVDVQRSDEQADARLIAAAPDLLHLAEFVSTWLNETSECDSLNASDAVVLARAALAKVRGEGRS